MPAEASTIVAPDFVRTMLRGCWQREPSSRPTISICRNALSTETAGLAQGSENVACERPFTSHVLKGKYQDPKAPSHDYWDMVARNVPGFRQLALYMHPELLLDIEDVQIQVLEPALKLLQQWTAAYASSNIDYFLPTCDTCLKPFIFTHLLPPIMSAIRCICHLIRFPVRLRSRNTPVSRHQKPLDPKARTGGITLVVTSRDPRPSPAVDISGEAAGSCSTWKPARQQSCEAETCKPALDDVRKGSDPVDLIAQSRSTCAPGPCDIDIGRCFYSVRKPRRPGTRREKGTIAQACEWINLQGLYHSLQSYYSWLRSFLETRWLLRFGLYRTASQYGCKAGRLCIVKMSL